MQTLRRSILIALVAGLFTAGCEHADPLDPNAIDPTLSSIQANVFNLHCAVSGCHDGNGTQLPGVMDLSAGQAFGSTVNVRSVENANLFRITPGDPDNSYLVRKIEGRAGIAGVRMPFGRPPLAPEQIEAVREWIADGAQDN